MHPHEPRTPEARRALGRERWTWVALGVLLLVVAAVIVWAT